MMGKRRAKGKPRYTREQLKTLDEARFSQNTDAINRRINAVYFWGLGLTQREVVRLAHVSPNTMRVHARVFETDGLAAVTTDDRHGRPSALAAHEPVIRAEFSARPPATVAQAKATIAQITGVKLQDTRIRLYLRSLGMKQRRLTPIPGKADPAKQEDFKKTLWNRCWTRPDPASERSTSSTPPTLSLAPS
jgi:transposase